jgi:hypothetical protein
MPIFGILLRPWGGDFGCISWPFGISIAILVHYTYVHLVFLLPFWLYFFHFGLFYQEKSGNPDKEMPTDVTIFLSGA